LVSTAVVLGWCLHDVGLILISGLPFEIVHRLPAMVFAIMLGVVAGQLLEGHPRSCATLILILVVLSFVPRVLETLGMNLPWSPAQATAPKALLLMVVAGWVTIRIGRRDIPGRGSRVFAVGILTGGAAAAALIIVRSPRFSAIGDLSWFHPVMVVGGAAVVIVGLYGPRRFLVPLPSAIGLAVSVGVTAQTWIDARAVRPLRVVSTVDRGTAASVGGPNLILIVLDTVRASHLAPYGSPRVTTPGLDDFVRRHATVWSQARSASPWTFPSHATLFTGLTPGQHGAVHTGRKFYADRSWIGQVVKPLSQELTTMAEVLSRRHYEAAAIVANVPMLMRGTGIEQGFSYYDDRGPRLFPVPGCLLVQLGGAFAYLGAEPYRDAGTISRTAMSWLSERRLDRPYFLFLNYMDAHRPRIPRAEFRTAFGEEQPRNPYHPPREVSPTLYDRKLRYLDHELIGFLHWLETRPDFERTVIVVTADHGEAFGEHGYWGHDRYLYEELIRVPLYVKEAGGEGDSTCDRPIEGGEVFGMILEHLGVVSASSTPQTRPDAEVYATAARPPLPASVPALAWLRGGRKSIVDADGTAMIFDLDRDPGETTNLATVAEADSLRERAAQWWRLSPEGHRGEDRPQLDDDTLDDHDRARLKALGYVEGAMSSQ
jgi:arylsulfatase A-like enzyme